MAINLKKGIDLGKHGTLRKGNGDAKKIIIRKNAKKINLQKGFNNEKNYS